MQDIRNTAGLLSNLVLSCCFKDSVCAMINKPIKMRDDGRS